MSATPRTDAAVVDLHDCILIDPEKRQYVTKYVTADFARQLERELTIAIAGTERWREIADGRAKERDAARAEADALQAIVNRESNRNDTLNALRTERDALQRTLTEHLASESAETMRADRACAEVDALRADAERYRWLREQSLRVDPLAAVVIKRFYDRNGEWCDVAILDAAIDAARSKP